ncbi:hypothetical protein C8R47DRAFT_1080220 [Mycena vitilis]|nr:hypothetical protein C8R47DRAFT_1080220 [Mycena vitilis]
MSTHQEDQWHGRDQNRLAAEDWRKTEANHPFSHTSFPIQTQANIGGKSRRDCAKQLHNDSEAAMRTSVDGRRIQSGREKERDIVVRSSGGNFRRHSCFVSGALFRDLEPVCCVDIPAIWLRRPGTLAANLRASDASFVWRICGRLPDVGSAILEEKGAPRAHGPTNLFDVERLSKLNT